MSNDVELRFGLAGLGTGGSGLVRSLTGHPHSVLTSVADVRESALDRARADHGVATYTSVEAMCASPDVDVVWVATPNHLHAEHVITAAEHGKHVVVSKPMALSIEECEAMNEAAERSGVKLMTGHTRSMAATIRKMAELVRSGEFGRLGMVHSWKWADWIYRPREPHELDVTKGGGVVYRQASHQIDIVRLIGGGLVRSVRAMTLELDPTRPAPGTYVAYLEFTDGTPCTAIYSGYGHFDTSELTYGRGAYRASRPVARGVAAETERELKEALRVKRSRPTPPTAETGDGLGFYGLTIVTCERADLRESPNGLFIYEDDGARRELVLATQEARGQNEVEEMYQAVVNGRPLFHDGRWGEATLEVALAIMQSGREQREIFLSHQTAVPA